jgi:hypothetical protein
MGDFLLGFAGWIVFSFIVAGIGSGRKVGFFGALAYSMLLSPVIGLIVVFFSKSDKEEEYEESVLQTQIEQRNTLEKIANQAVQKQAISISDEILKLKELQNQGILTEEEFEAQKKKLLEK